MLCMPGIIILCFKRVDAVTKVKTHSVHVKKMLYELKSAYTELFGTTKDQSGWRASNLPCMFKDALHVSPFHEKK